METLDTIEQERQLNADELRRMIGPDPHHPGPERARLVEYDIPVWAIVGHIQTIAGDVDPTVSTAVTVARVAHDFAIPTVAVVAALRFYAEHRAAIDARLSDQRGDLLLQNGQAVASSWRVALEPTFKRLAEFVELEHDWDSYGGSPPSRLALDLAERHVETVAELLGPIVGERAGPSAVSPLAYGGVELEWREPGKLLAVEIGPDGELGYLLREGEGAGAHYQEDDNVPRATVLGLLFQILAP